VKNDQPVPDDRERKKQIEDVRRIEYAGLQRREKRYAAVLVRIPEWKGPMLQKVYPEDFRRDKKGREVSLYKNDSTRQHAIKVKERENEQDKEIEHPREGFFLKRLHRIYNTSEQSSYTMNLPN
jgi:hypothetical protein